MSIYDVFSGSKPFDKAEWAAQKQAQRKEAYELIDNTCLEMTSGGDAFRSYLEVQGRFDRYSVNNAILVSAQMPEAMQLKEKAAWKANRVYVNKDAQKVIILEPGKEYTREDGSKAVGYNAKEVYDISQTSARGQEPPRVSWDDRLLLKALIHKSPVSLRVVEQVSKSGRGALYSPEQNAILVKKGMDAPDIFRCVSLELAKVELAALHQGETRDTAGYQAFCVSYMLCKKYGVDTQSYDTSHLHEIFMGKEPDTIKSELKDMENVMGNINSRMARVLYPEREKNRAEQERGGREKW